MLENVSYCPLLKARVAEMKALSQLPDASKDRIFPVLAVRPWPNAKRLDHAWEKVEEVLEDHRFALDLDRSKRGASDSPAGSEFTALFGPADGFSAYYELVGTFDRAVPVLRWEGAEPADLQRQLAHVERLDRGLVLRLQHDLPGNHAAVLASVLELHPDTTVVIDGGWSRELLLREAWASNLVRIATSVRDDIEIVIAGSSFPQSFANMKERAETRIDERFLYDAIRRQHNAAVVTYGDWGSTREQTPATPMKSRPRLDLPMPREWVSFRSVDGEDFQAVAARVVEDKFWSSTLGIWGTYVFKATADDLPGAIRSPAMATAARINIHLHKQAQFGAAQEVNDGDEPFTDDL